MNTPHQQKLLKSEQTGFCSKIKAEKSEFELVLPSDPRSSCDAIFKMLHERHDILWLHEHVP